MADGADRAGGAGGPAGPGGSDPLADVTATQMRVADPGVSAWVSANAGSGKTYVLIQRVTRLLLAGTPPARIVCITYTKAAAAEMADRLFLRLGAWALLGDAELSLALREVVGEAEVANADLGAARRLFARALETPGGLKIQTIHAFCEMVLRRFPAEAGLLPGFEVLEEAEADEAMRGIVSRLAEDALDADPALLDAFDTLGADYKPASGSGFGFQTSLHDVLAGFAGHRHAVARAHAAAGGVEGFVRGLYARHEMSGDETGAGLRAAACAAADTLFLREVADGFRVGGKRAVATAGQVAAFLDGGSACFDTLTGIALTQKLEARQPSWWGKATDKVADFEARWAELAEGVRAGHDALEALAFCRLNAALHRLGHRFATEYEQFKARAGRLDFEDLIDRTARLLRDTSNAWVLYKLDQGIEHVLLDEAQDTAAPQWEVIQALTAEFFAGEGAERDRPRTLFVVGDEKQSIYSFQGADAALFDEKLKETRVAAGERFANAPMGLSFRTTPPVLDFVDAVFADARAPLMDRYERHRTRYPGGHGAVEVWPLPEKDEAPKGQAWDTPLDVPAPNDPKRALADAICERIKGWLDGDEPLGNPERAVTPGDILILCQTRGPQFHEIVGALSRHGIPAAGADKVRLKDDVAVRDMIALMRFATNQGDCLSLAELLRSPFWGVTEEELFALAHGRKGRLWAVVTARAEGTDALAAKCRAARDEIEAAITEGRRAGAFAMLSGLLERGHPTGRQRIARRLGRVPDEALGELLAEALDWESRHARTIEGFLDHIERFDGEVKKEQGKAEGEGAVRVMTVHGAKGLEAPIVFLADAAHRKQESNAFKRNPLVPLGGHGPDGYAPEPGCLVCAPAGKDAGPQTVRAAKAHAEAARLAEYRRLLYVAATRAAERLYVCGVANRHHDPDAEDTVADWHTLATRAAQRMGAAVVQTPLGPALRYEAGARISGPGAVVADLRDHPVPDWLSRMAAPERAAPDVRPSQGGLTGEDDADAGPGGDDGPAYPPQAPGRGQAWGREPYRRGNALHRLLERLPDVAPDARAATGRALLAGFAPSGAEADAWLAEALGVLGDPRFADVFAPGGLAEVPVVGRVGGRTVRGQIDRLLVTPDEIVIVDFKSNRPPPARVEEVSEAVLFQLAAYEALMARVYPGRRVRSALLWTYAPRLMPVPAEALSGALARGLG